MPSSACSATPQDLPSFPTRRSSDLEAIYVLEHSDSIGVLVEDDEQRAKVHGFEQVISFDELDELRAEGRAFAVENPDALDARIADVGEDDLYTYIYTSGTTGPPKGCMIRHRNYFEMPATIERIESLAIGADVMLLYLP